MSQHFPILVLLAISSLLAACEPAERDIEKTITVVDFTGTTVALAKPAKRIVALAPHLVENVYSAGAGEFLLGVIEHSDFPEQAKQLPIVGGHEKINHERILELEPDLVLVWQSGNSHNSVELLRELGLTIYVNQANELEDVARTIRDIGKLAGTDDKAESIAKTYLAILEKVQKKYQQAEKISSFYQVWNSPLQTINGNHIISNAIELCGGVNIYADEFAVAPIVNIESVLKRDPQVIIASGTSAVRPEWLDQWKQWPNLRAVQKNNLFYVNPDHIQRHTVRLLDGINRVCKQFDLARARG